MYLEFAVDLAWSGQQPFAGPSAAVEAVAAAEVVSDFAFASVVVDFAAFAGPFEAEFGVAAVGSAAAAVELDFVATSESIISLC